MGKNGKPASETREEKRAKSASKERRRPVVRAVKYTLVTIGSAIVLGAGAASGYIAAMVKGLPSVSASTFANNRAASIVYDRNGKVIGRFTSEGDRQPIQSLGEVSPNLVNSFVAAEDKTFYSNIGINPLAIARASIQDLRGHRIESGASTITQQTVKLALFPEQQRTMRRKIQEIALALKLNHILTKDEIMTDYMNWVYMGNMGVPVYGVKTASEILFHKDPKDLNLAESAFLAAIPNNASYYSPYQYPKHVLQRQHYILAQLLQNHTISQVRYNQAMKFDVVKEIKPHTSTMDQHPYLMIDEIAPRLYQALVNAGVYESVAQAEAAVPTAGYKIYTTIDMNMQNDVDKVLQNNTLFAGTNLPNPYNSKLVDLYEAGFTLLDNQTGGILALGGGRDFNKDSYDHTDLARQPGSSIKPILDYGPAIDTEQLTAASVLDDAPHTWPGGDGNPFAPKDDETDWAGIMTARQALTESRNVPAVEVLQKITPQTGLQYLAKMGITPSSKTIHGQPTLSKNDAGLAMAIGGLTNGLTLQQMTDAYTTFADQGTWHQSYLISDIKDQQGNVVFQAKPKATQVFKPQTAYILTNMMHDVVTQPDGTANMIGSRFPGYQISGKTGTTDNQSDGWFIGYTQRYTAGIWMGYNNHQPIASGYNYNLKFTIWNDIMAQIFQNNPPTQQWSKPSGVVSVAVCKKSGQLPTSLCTQDNDVYSELFIDGTQPTTQCQVHVKLAYTVINGKKYLATTNTPPNQVKIGIFLKPPFAVPDVVTDDSAQYAPTQADPRGGQVLNAGSAPVGSLQPGLEAPSGVSSTVNGSQVTLTWKPVQNATSYTVWRASNPNGPFANIGTVQSPTYTDQSVPGGTNTVYYQLYAVSSTAMSSASAVIGVPMQGGPLPPGGNTTNQTSTNPPADNSTKTVRKKHGKVDWMPGVGNH